jgi:hypothetical protein
VSRTLVSSLLSRPEALEVPAILLLGGPYVVINGCRREVPDGSKRLLVFVALSPGRVNRRYAAGALWPFGNDERAAGNLRSALWRLRCAEMDMVDSDKCGLMLRQGTVVDVAVLCDGAGPILGPRSWPVALPRFR